MMVGLVDAVDGSSTGTKVPRMWGRLRLPRFGGATRVVAYLGHHNIQDTVRELPPDRSKELEAIGGTLSLVNLAATWNVLTLWAVTVRPEGKMRRDCVVPVLLWILLIGSVAAMRLVSLPALGRDLDGHFAESPLKPWFDQLKSGWGRCCSGAGGRGVGGA